MSLSLKDLIGKIILIKKGRIKKYYYIHSENQIGNLTIYNYIFIKL